jgi:hypothetical protein
MSGVVVGKTKAGRGGGEVTVDEVPKTGGELGGGEVVGVVVGKTAEEVGGGEVVMGVAGKTGGEVGGGEEMVPLGSDKEIGEFFPNSWSSSGDDTGTVSVFEGDT